MGHHKKLFLSRTFYFLLSRLLRQSQLDQIGINVHNYKFQSFKKFKQTKKRISTDFSMKERLLLYIIQQYTYIYIFISLPKKKSNYRKVKKKKIEQKRKNYSF